MKQPRRFARQGSVRELQRRGVLLRACPLSLEVRRALKREMLTRPTSPASVSAAGRSRIALRYRRSQVVAVSDSARQAVMSALESLRPRLERFFALRLGRCQEPVFLSYCPGEYFRAHRDNGGDPRQPEHIRRRCVTVVMFVNSIGREYTGGELRLLRLQRRMVRAPERVEWHEYVRSVRPKSGLCVAFRADVLHEVEEVRRGQRLSIAAWFERATPNSAGERAAR